MLSLADVRTLAVQQLKELVDEEHIYSGKMPDKKDRSIGIYNQRRGTPVRKAVGCEASYKVKAVSILIHWNKSQRDTEKATGAVYDVLKSISNTEVDGTKVLFVKMAMDEAVDIGTDDNGIFEMVIELEIYYERTDS